MRRAAREARASGPSRILWPAMLPAATLSPATEAEPSSAALAPAPAPESAAADAPLRRSPADHESTDAASSSRAAANDERPFLAALARDGPTTAPDETTGVALPSRATRLPPRSPLEAPARVELELLAPAPPMGVGAPDASLSVRRIEAANAARAAAIRLLSPDSSAVSHSSCCCNRGKSEKKSRSMMASIWAAYVASGSTTS